MNRRNNSLDLRKGRFGPRPYLALAATAALWFSAGGGLPLGAFTGCTESKAEISTAADFMGPTITSVISKSPGYSPGYVKYNGTYYIYANAVETDPTNGHPPSGVNTSSLTANVAVASNILTTGATSVALSSSGGPWSVGGTSYTYRSASQTVNNALISGGTFTQDRTFQVTASDTAGNSKTTDFTVNINNNTPTATNITANDGGGTQGRPEAGDTLIYTTSKSLDPESILSSWTGSSTAVVLRFVNSSSNDIINIYNAANTTQLPLGSITTGANFVGTSPAWFNATMVRSGQDITITLGSLIQGSASQVQAQNMTWTPSTTAYDVNGVNMSATAFTEPNPADRDF